MYAIKFNNAACKTVCCKCDEWFDPEVGYVVTVHDSFDILCDECARREAPELALVLPVVNDIGPCEPDRRGFPPIPFAMLWRRLLNAGEICRKEEQRLHTLRLVSEAKGEELNPAEITADVMLTLERAFRLDLLAGPEFDVPPDRVRYVPSEIYPGGPITFVVNGGPGSEKGEAETLPNHP